MKLTTHLHLVLRSREREAIPPPPYTLPWHRDNFTIHNFRASIYTHNERDD